MSEKLEAYLDEIGHFLSGRAEREEILADLGVVTLPLYFISQSRREVRPVELERLSLIFQRYFPPSSTCTTSYMFLPPCWMGW